MAYIILPIVFVVIIAGVILLNLALAIIKGTIQNIVIADAIIVTGVMIFLIHSNGVHMVFSILLGLVVGSCFVALTKIHVFGKIFVVICGLGWAFGVYQLIDDFGIFYKLNNDPIYTKDPHVLSELLEKDPIWWWTIVIIMVLVFVGLHLKCVIKSTNLDDSEEYQPEIREVSVEELLAMSTSIHPNGIQSADVRPTESKEHELYEIYTPTAEELANDVPYDPNKK